MMVLGGFLAAAAALLAGASGFGFGLVATPALLLTGFALRFVITVNLLLTVATRASVAWRFRHAVQPRHVAVLVGFGVPGLWAGSRTLGAVDEHVLKLVVGVAVALAAAALALADRRPLRRAIPGVSAAAGFLGGLLGTTTSLIGVPPALLLVRRRLPTETFFADLAVFFVATAAIGLAVLAVQGQFDEDAASAFLWWLPGVLVANMLGASAGVRARPWVVRRLTLGLAFAGGILTALTA